MTKPTREQIEEFWEWCGFTSKIVKRKSADFNGIYYGQDGTFHKPPQLYDVKLWHEPEMQGLPNEDKWFAKNGLPPIDLNNLFKYAVPKLKDIGAIEFILPENKIQSFECNLKKSPGTDDYFGGSKDPALALFWAIYEVIK